MRRKEREKERPRRPRRRERKSKEPVDARGFPLGETGAKRDELARGREEKEVGQKERRLFLFSSLSVLTGVLPFRPLSALRTFFSANSKLLVFVRGLLGNTVCLKYTRF